MREIYWQSKLFRIVIVSLAGAVAFALVVAILVNRIESRTIASESAAVITTTEPTTEAPPEEEEQQEMITSYAPVTEEPDGPEISQPQRDDERAQRQNQRQGSNADEPTDSPERANKQKPAPQPEREPPNDPVQNSGNERSLPIQGDDWPGADRQEVRQTEKKREYGWKQGAVMTLSSPALNVSDAPIFGDDSERNLARGVAHVPQTSLPWQRGKQKNVYLAAHRLGWPGTDSRLIFYNLGDLEKGDKVSLKNRQGERYRYKVTEKLVVKPTDRWVMGEVRNKDMLTLQTCTPIPTFDKRLIVRAERI